MARRELERNIRASSISSHTVREASQRLRSRPGKKLSGEREPKVQLPPQTFSQADPPDFCNILPLTN